MKTYSITQLKKLAKEQGYKFAALEDSTGKRIQAFNRPTIKIDSHLNTILKRLTSEIYDDGIYTVCCSRAINGMADSDKYNIVKGKLKAENMPITTQVIDVKSNDVLTWESALKMQQTISDLKAEVQQLKFENNLLQSEIDAVNESDNLSEGAAQNGAELKSGAQTFLSETLPSLLPILDRYFDSEDKKTQLRLLELQKTKRPQIVKREIVTGSQEHLNIIEHYFKTNQEDKLNIQLDKLEKANPNLYNEVLKKLGLDEEESEGESE